MDEGHAAAELTQSPPRGTRVRGRRGGLAQLDAADPEAAGDDQRHARLHLRARTPVPLPRPRPDRVLLPAARSCGTPPRPSACPAGSGPAGTSSASPPRSPPGAGFGLAIVDEAHRTAGDLGRPWAAIHDNARIPAGFRLYLTATPRIRAAARPQKAGGQEAEIASTADDPDGTYGRWLAELGLSESPRRRSGAGAWPCCRPHFSVKRPTGFVAASGSNGRPARTARPEGRAHTSVSGQSSRRAPIAAVWRV